MWENGDRRFLFALGRFQWREDGFEGCGHICFVETPNLGSGTLEFMVRIYMCEVYSGTRENAFCESVLPSRRLILPSSSVIHGSLASQVKKTTMAILLSKRVCLK